MDFMTPYWGYMFLFAIVIVLPWLVWRTFVWLTEVTVERWRSRRATSTILSNRLLFVAKRKEVSKRGYVWVLGTLVALAGGIGLAVWAREYGHLDILVWSVLGFFVLLASAKRLEWPVRRPRALKAVWQGEDEDEEDTLAWRGALNPLDFSGRPNAIMGELNEDIRKFDG